MNPSFDGAGAALASPATTEAAVRAATLRAAAEWWRADLAADVVAAVAAAESPVEPGGSRAVVTLAGSPFADAAARHARLTGASLVELPSLDALASGDVFTDGTTVVVVAPAALLALDMLEALGAAASEAGARIGYITGDDAEAVEWALRKARLMLAGGLPAYGRAFADALRGRAGLAGSKVNADPAELVEASYTALYLVGHGDGAHVELGKLAVCGLDGAVERVGGKPVTNGCRHGAPHSCKKVRPGEAEVAVRAADLRTQVLALFTCSSLSMPASLYPSDLSIAVAAARGIPGAVIGTTRQLAFEADVVDLADALVASGATLGRVVDLLNQVHEIAGFPPCYALFGDPDATVPAATTARPRWPVVRVVEWPDGAPDVVRADALTDDFHAVHGSRSTVLFGAREFESAPLVTDADEELARAQAAFADLHRRVVDGEGIERVVGYHARHYALMEYAGTYIGPVANARRQAADAAWYGLGLGVVPSRGKGIWQPALDEAQSQARARVVDWTASLALLTQHWLMPMTIEGKIGGDHLVPSVGFFRVLGDVYETGETCGRCGGAVGAREYDGSVAGLSRRVELLCASCGTLATYPDTLRVAAHVGGDLRPGGRVDAEISVTYGGHRWGSPLHLVISTRDRSRHDPMFIDRLELEPGSVATTVSFDLPEDAGNDLWVLRVAAVCDGAIAYARHIYTPCSTTD